MSNGTAKKLINPQAQIDALTASLAKAESDKEGLTGTLAARDTFIATLTSEKVALAGSVVDLQAQLRGKDKELQSMAAQVASTQKQIAERDARIAAADATVAALKKQVTELQAKGTTEPELRAQIESVRLKNDALEKELSQKNTTLAQTTSDYGLLQLRYNDVRAEANSLALQAAALQKEKEAVVQQLATLNQRTQAAFSADKLAEYLGKTIDRFNALPSVTTPSVNYVINQLDLELKAMIGKNDANEMTMSAPALGTAQEQALSSIRLTIRSVPKDD